MLSGVDAFGFVSWSQVLETWPSMPPGALASAITTITGIAASDAEQHAAGELLRLRRGGPLGGEEAGDEAERESSDEHQQQQRAELVAGVGAHRQRQVVGR